LYSANAETTLVHTLTAVLLDDDADLLDILSELLEQRGCRCLLARSLDELKALGPEALAADVAVLDINLGAGQPSGIDAYDWLLSQGFAGRLLFLTGHAHAHPLVARAERLNRATVLDKPLDGQVLLDRIMGVGVGRGTDGHVTPA
jgi:DNA-binding NtrC family response regulator